MAWTRSAMERSCSGISAILASTSRSPSTRSSAGSRREAAFRSRMVSCIAARSTSDNTLAELRAALVFLADVFSLVGMLFSSSGSRFLGDLSLLQDPDWVAEGIAQAHVGAIEMVGGLLRE